MSIDFKKYYNLKEDMMIQNELKNNIVDCRQTNHNYDENTSFDIQIDKEEITAQIKRLNRPNRSKLFPNQISIADEILSSLNDSKIFNVMVIARTQSGKTGAMLAFINSYVTNINKSIPTENIYIITGLSSISWKHQTKNRMPKALHDRVFHRDDLLKYQSKFIKDIKNKKNVLILMDEIQIAAKYKQTINKVFEKCHLNNLQYLFKKDIKIVEFSATPDGTLYDIEQWNPENKKVILMDPGIGYTSSYNLYEQKRIYQCRDLYCHNKMGERDMNMINKNIGEIKTLINNNYNNEPAYHIIRTHNNDKKKNKRIKTIENFKIIFEDSVEYEFFDGETEETNINNILEIKPKKNTFIFIKEKLRCAITLNKKYLGILYERAVKSPNDSVMIQGLLGRGTGYDDNGKTLIFTHIPSLKKYELFWSEDGFSIDNLKMWNSNTTSKKGPINKFNTYKDGRLIMGMELKRQEHKESKKEPIVKEFKTYEEANRYVIDNLSSNKLRRRGLNKPKYNKDGFIESSMRSIKKVWSYDEIINDKKCNISNGAGYGIRYCYRDINNKNTLVCLVIHYPIENNLQIINNIDQDCVICLQNINQESEIKILPCAHIYHKNCINEWINVNRSCPTCRTEC